MTLSTYLRQRLVITSLLRTPSRINTAQAAAVAFTMESHQRELLNRHLIEDGIDEATLGMLGHQVSVLEIVEALSSKAWNAKHNAMVPTGVESVEEAALAPR